MSARSAVVGIGLTASLVAGCGTTVGSGFAARRGECISMQGSFELAPNQEMYSGGDITFDRGPDDYLSLQNVEKAGQRVLEVVRSGDDDGTLTIGNSVFPPEDGDDPTALTIHFTNKPDEDVSIPFTYVEDRATTNYTASFHGSSVVLNFTVSCAAKK